MSKPLLVVLVIVVIVTGVPLVMAMPPMCHECGPAIVAAGGAGCAAVLVTFVLLVVLASEMVRSAERRILTASHGGGIERPPRLA